MIYTVTFNPAIDYVIHMENLKPGTVNRTQAEEIQYGGKGINVSAVLKNLGVESTAWGFLAGFTGDEIDKGLSRMGIRSDFIHLKEGLTRINIKIKSGLETEINGCGPDIDMTALQDLYCKFDSVRDGDILVLAGSIPKSLPNDIYERIMGKLQGRRISVVVDATGDLLVNVLKYRPFLIKPNNHELGEIFGKVLYTQDEIKLCSRELQKKGARNVLVSMAEEGALLLDETGMLHTIDAPPGEVKNSVGAGDSMVAGFLAGYLEKQDYKYALRMGAAAGSATAFSKGLATQDEVYALLKRI